MNFSSAISGNTPACSRAARRRRSRSPPCRPRSASRSACSARRAATASTRGCARSSAATSRRSATRRSSCNCSSCSSACRRSACISSEYVAAILAMTLNLGAYSVEIIRAGIAAVPKGHHEAAASLAMSRGETFRHVVLPQAIAKVFPALTSQIVITMLGSAVVSQISVPDLTYAASYIQSRNFRAFETYFLITAAYLVMAIVLRCAAQRSGQAPLLRAICEARDDRIHIRADPHESVARRALDHRAVDRVVRRGRHGRLRAARDARVEVARAAHARQRSTSRSFRARRF